MVLLENQMVGEIPIRREAGMELRSRKEITARFNAYVDALTKLIGHADRNEPLRDYCAGLLATEGRRSVEMPMMEELGTKAAILVGEAEQPPAAPEDALWMDAPDFAVARAGLRISIFHLKDR